MTTKLKSGIPLSGRNAAFDRFCARVTDLVGKQGFVGNMGLEPGKRHLVGINKRIGRRGTLFVIYGAGKTWEEAYCAAVKNKSHTVLPHMTYCYTCRDNRQWLAPKIGKVGFCPVCGTSFRKGTQ